MIRELFSPQVSLNAASLSLPLKLAWAIIPMECVPFEPCSVAAVS